MPFLILGLAAMAGGIAAWALFRNTTQLPGQGAAADTDRDMKTDAAVVPGPGASSSISSAVKENTSGITAQSVAEGNDTVAQRADEGEDRYESSGAAAQAPTLERWTADAFLDEDPFVPTVSLTTRIVNDAVPDVINGWVVDDIVSPRDLAGAPVAGEMGMLETELK